MRIHEFNLVYRQKFDLRFSLVKFDFAADANDFPCERTGQSQFLPRLQ